MQEPADKPFDPVVSPLFINAIHEELRGYDGRRVGDERPCPNCASEDLRKNGYQNEPKTFVRLVTADGLETVGVEVQQYQCTDCGRSFQGDLSELFYDDCGYAKPVVDLCRFHATNASASACSRTLRRQYGVLVTDETITRYERRFDGVEETATIDIGGYTYSLPFLSSLFGDPDDDSPHFVIQRSKAIW